MNSLDKFDLGSLSGNAVSPEWRMAIKASASFDNLPNRAIGAATAGGALGVVAMVTLSRG